MRRALFVVATVIALLSAACGGDDGGSGGMNMAEPLPIKMTAANFKFDPKTFTAHSGHEVALTFVNEDDTEHSFTIDELDFEVEAEGGDEATATFKPTDAGKLEFYCKYHPDSMTGTITVE